MNKLIISVALITVGCQVPAPTTVRNDAQTYPPTPIAMPVIYSYAAPLATQSQPEAIHPLYQPQPTYEPQTNYQQSPIPSSTVNQCEWSDKQAFDVGVLQSELMIAALNCGEQNEYNAFVGQHHQELNDSYMQITLHFHKLYGADGDSHRDEYITELANTLSQAGTQQNDFCRFIHPLVDQALTLQTADDMSRFVAVNNIAPVADASCR